MRSHLQPEIQSAGRGTESGPPVAVGEFPPVGESHPAVPDGSDPKAPDEKSDIENCYAGVGTASCSCGDSDLGKSGRFCGIVAGFLIILIKIYQKIISPLFPPCCRFYPSCSNYAVEALRIHGLIRGLCLSVWRILRCQPWCRGGYDPVPPPKSGKKNDEV